MLRTLVVGIGSTIRGDDGVGVVVATKLAEGLSTPGVDILELGTCGLGLLDWIRNYDRLIILDAMISGEKPGTVRVLRGDRFFFGAHLAATHEADLSSTLALGRKLLGAHIPEQVFVVAVAVEPTKLNTFTESLSHEVAEAVPKMLDEVSRLLKNW